MNSKEFRAELVKIMPGYDWTVHQSRLDWRLEAAGIQFESKNGGAHLVVSAAGLVVDFWPGTGLWVVRGTNERRRGVRHLIKRLGGQWPPQGKTDGEIHP